MGALRLVLLSLLVACGSSNKTTETPSSDGDGAAACEPGRCLPDISKAVSERRDDARKCFDEAQKRDASLKGGAIVINFAIDAEGVVGETSQGLQDDQITEQGVVDCVSTVIKGVRFSKSSKGKTTRAYHRFEFGG